jgi:hypothetical protein
VAIRQEQGIAGRLEEGPVAFVACVRRQIIRIGRGSSGSMHYLAHRLRRSVPLEAAMISRQFTPNSARKQ